MKANPYSRYSPGTIWRKLSKMVTGMVVAFLISVSMNTWLLTSLLYFRGNKMRKELQQINGIRHRFIATFVRFGSKAAYKGPPIKTLLFSDVKDKGGKVYTDHLWFTITK